MEWLHRRLKLSHHRHSGRKLPHAHTSHGALVIIVLATGIMLGLATRAALVSAQTASQSGSVNLAGTVSAPAPATAPSITQPANNAVFRTSNIVVKGTCPPSTMVEIYKNNLLAGSAACQNQAFQLNIDLVVGENVLTARAIDNLGQYSPTSAAVTVRYQPLGPTASAQQLIIIPSAGYYGVVAGDLFRLELNIQGGKAPYAVSIDWGDQSSDVISRETAGEFAATHTFESAGLYRVRISASDTAGNKAFTELTVLIGHTGPTLTTTPEGEPPTSGLGALDIIWPLYVSALFAVLMFWLGELYMKEKLVGLWKTRRHV